MGFSTAQAPWFQIPSWSLSQDLLLQAGEILARPSEARGLSAASAVVPLPSHVFAAAAPHSPRLWAAPPTRDGDDDERADQLSIRLEEALEHSLNNIIEAVPTFPPGSRAGWAVRLETMLDPHQRHRHQDLVLVISALAKIIPHFPDPQRYEATLRFDALRRDSRPPVTREAEKEIGYLTRGLAPRREDIPWNASDPAPFVYSFGDSLSYPSLRLLELKSRRGTQGRETQLMSVDERDDLSFPIEFRLRRLAERLTARESHLRGRASVGGWLLGPGEGLALWPSWDPDVLAETVWEILDGSSVGSSRGSSRQGLAYHRLELNASFPGGEAHSLSDPETARRHESLRSNPQKTKNVSPYRSSLTTDNLPFSVHNDALVDFSIFSEPQDDADFTIQNIDYASKLVIVKLRIPSQEPYGKAVSQTAYLQLSDRDWSQVFPKSFVFRRESIHEQRIEEILSREISKKLFKREIRRQIRLAWIRALLKFVPLQPQWLHELPDDVRRQVCNLSAKIERAPLDLELLESLAERLAKILLI
jgi:hypothetical protein